MCQVKKITPQLNYYEEGGMLEWLCWSGTGQGVVRC